MFVQMLLFRGSVLPHHLEEFSQFLSDLSTQENVAMCWFPP